MIVRVTRARIKPNTESAVFALLRGYAAGVATPAGMQSMHIARRFSEPTREEELIAITVWTDIDALIAPLGPEFRKSSFLPALDEYLIDTHVELFETVIDAFSDLASAGV